MVAAPLVILVGHHVTMGLPALASSLRIWIRRHRTVSSSASGPAPLFPPVPPLPLRATVRLRREHEGRRAAALLELLGSSGLRRVAAAAPSSGCRGEPILVPPRGDPTLGAGKGGATPVVWGLGAQLLFFPCSFFFLFLRACVGEEER